MAMALEEKGVLNMTKIDLFGALFFIICGFIFSLFHKKLGHLAVEFQYKILHIRFNETGCQIAYLLGGIFATIFGILMLFGIIKFK